MSFFWSATDGANYLSHDLGSNSTFSYPFTYGCFVKVPASRAAIYIPMSHTSNQSASVNYYGNFGVRTDGRIDYGERSTTHSFSTSAVSPIVADDTWTPIVVVVTSNTNRRVYWGSASNTNSSSVDSGTPQYQRYIGFGKGIRESPPESPQTSLGFFAGYIARAAFWKGVALDATAVGNYMAGDDPTGIEAASLFAYWPMDNGNLNDLSGNANHLTMSGTVASSTDEPIAISSTNYVPVLSPLYYGATLLANKTSIEYTLRTGHTSGLEGALLASGTNGTTDASGNFQHPAGEYGVTDDPVTLSLYWEEGSAPVVDRSLIVKTTLAEDV